MEGTKDVTRRFGWWFLKPGDSLCVVEKSQGLKKGEKIKRLGVIEVVSVRKEALGEITHEDCIREGFPHFGPVDFINMLMDHYKNVGVKTPCNRIEFKKLFDTPLQHASE